MVGVYIVCRYILSMRRQSALILAALADQPRHGYAIIAKAAELSSDDKRLAPGTLYTALSRFEEDGLVEIDHEVVVDGRNRRYYRITEHGLHSLWSEVERTTREADAMRGQISLGGWSPA